MLTAGNATTARFTFPWLVAAASTSLAIAAWFGSPSEPAQRVGERPSENLQALSAQRRELAAEKAVNALLRSELDRLAARLANHSGGEASRGGAADQRPTVSPESTPSVVAARLKELAGRYRDDLLRSIAGDEAARENAYREIMDLIRSGPDAFSALRDAYIETADPEARAIMLRALVSGRGTELPEFLASELRDESDSDLRRALADKASEVAWPGAAPILKERFLELLRPETDLETRLAAIRGLRYAYGSEVDEALIAAAADASEDARIAALETLLVRPGGRDTVRALVQNDSSARVQEVGRCRLLLSE